MGLNRLTFLGSEHRRKQCGSDENTGAFRNGRNRETARKTKGKLPLVVKLWSWLEMILLLSLVMLCSDKLVGKTSVFTFPRHHKQSETLCGRSQW